ncbi:hypothetical protein SAMN02745221_01797 [Thermosyntropha lipolytica DSM 11003]|uniref:UPF0122 protein SAMN02745221_01797 n=1 Tax=Thermosyntropha lipolytica DSM 11003 TaxID=1123382 RepID=A0A1M5QLM3_9FIRM|nr:YlxM family DNA-binding protein [Thermosyntropha lipolytica]SHH15035.1 hypothetical protein SAMN02745221_01797 [Thermosyntropha lipolytica DSM 11003]
MLDKREYLIILKDFYASLLTDKQQYVLELYYEHDLSLSEIAEEMGISRQAVYDLLKRSEGLLHDYEAKLGLVQRFLAIKSKLEKVCTLLEDDKWGTDDDRRHEIAGMLREITELL